MKKIRWTENGLNTLNMQSQKKAVAAHLETTGSQFHYHEFPSPDRETKDVLKTLESNIQLLEDLGGRLNFMLSDLQSLICRKKPL